MTGQAHFTHRQYGHILWKVSIATFLILQGSMATFPIRALCQHFSMMAFWQFFLGMVLREVWVVTFSTKAVCQHFSMRAEWTHFPPIKERRCKKMTNARPQHRSRPSASLDQLVFASIKEMTSIPRWCWCTWWPLATGQSPSHYQTLLQVQHNSY